MKVIVLLALVAVAAASTLTPTDAPPASVPVAWNYAQGGSDWPGTCSTGQAQSPININTSALTCVKEGQDGVPHRIDFHYVKKDNLTLRHNGHALSVKGDLGFITLGGCNPCDGQQYNVKAFSFHAPGEHTIDASPTKDGRYGAELHIVHQKVGSTGLNDLVIVAVNFYLQADGGFPNSFLDNINWANAPQTAKTSVAITGAVDLDKLKEALSGEYFTYTGSLTSPPCTEGVKWFVMKRPLGVNKAQLDVIQNLFQKKADFAAGRGNNRNVQNTNNRVVYWYRKRN